VSKIIYDKIKYLGLQSSFIISNAFEQYLKNIAFNGYIIFNNKDFCYILSGELFAIKRIDDVKRPWFADVYELNPKCLVFFMNFKDGNLIENLKISPKSLDIIIKNTIETTSYFWVEVKHKDDLYDIIYFSSEICGIYKNSQKVERIFENEFSEKIEIKVLDFKNLFETKKTEMIRILYLKRFESIWNKYKDLIIREYGREKAEIEFRKIQKELAKKFPILDPLVGFIDLDKELNLKIQSLNENEINAIVELLLEFYKRALPKKYDLIKEEIL
jgi:hypothetical protein